VAAVRKVLELAEAPMRVSEIHAATETLLGAPIAYSSVKEALSAHTRSSNQGFRRTGHGCYEVS